MYVGMYVVIRYMDVTSASTLNVHNAVLCVTYTSVVTGWILYEPKNKVPRGLLIYREREKV